jgi:hypothetical protein
MIDYDTTAGQIQIAAWEVWTRNGLGLDAEQVEETLKSALDATHGAYIDGISVRDWLAATLERLGA